MLPPRVNKIIRWICYAVGGITVASVVLIVGAVISFNLLLENKDREDELTRANTLQQVPAVEIEFAKVKQTILSVTPHDTIEQKEDHYANTLLYAPGCFRVGEAWLFKPASSISKVIEIYSKTKPLSAWGRYEQFNGGYGYISTDGKWQMSVEQDQSENGQMVPNTLVVTLYYTSPSFAGCT